MKGAVVHPATLASAPGRFMAKVWVDKASGCWIWIGSKNTHGYGQFGPGGDMHHVLAHRWSYEHHRGSIPEGLELDHLCRTPSCVNPEHLEPVPHLINMRRGVPRKTACDYGHDWTVPGNVYVRPDTGARFCRACSRERRTALRVRRLAEGLIE